MLRLVLLFLVLLGAAYAVDAIGAWLIVMAGPIGNEPFLPFLPSVAPSDAAMLGAGVTALVVLVAVIDRGDWLTTVWRSGLVFAIAMLILVAQFAAADLEAAHENPSGQYQCFVVNGSGSAGNLTSRQALYFTAGTLTTAGTGSVYPISDYCRRLVSIQTGIGAFVLLLGVGGVLWRIMQHPENSPESYESALALSYRRQGDLVRDLGQLHRAEQLYVESLTAFQALTQLEPTNEEYQWNLLSAFARLGDVAFRLENDAQAEHFGREAVAAAERRARPNRRDLDAQLALALAYERLGAIMLQLKDSVETERFYSRALAIREALAAADPSNRRRQRELAASYSNNFGNLYLQRDEPVEAEVYYRQALQIASKLTAADPSNGGDQRDLAGVLLQLGTVTLEQGDAVEAEANYRAALRIAESLAAANPSNDIDQRRLAIIRMQLGTARLQQGEAAEAENHYRAALPTFERLARKDTSDGGSDRDLAAVLAQLGAAMLQQGNAPEAERLYRDALPTFETLAHAHPSQPVAQRDLWACYHRLARSILEQGDQVRAASFFRKALRVREVVAISNPDDLTAQRDLTEYSRELEDLLSDEDRPTDTGGRPIEAPDTEQAPDVDERADLGLIKDEAVPGHPFHGQIFAIDEDAAAAGYARAESQQDLWVGLVAAGALVASVLVGGVVLTLALTRPSSWALEAVQYPAGGHVSYLSSVSCSSPNDCVAVGDHVFRALSEQWKGTRWLIRPQPKSTLSQSLSSVSCPSTKICLAVGGLGSDSSGSDRGARLLGEQWNDISWTPQRAPLPPGAALPPYAVTTPYNLDAVSCSSARACTAVGFDSRGSSEAMVIERWNGNAWAGQAASLAQRGSTESRLTGVSCSSGTACEAVGVYNENVFRLPLALRWNGNLWMADGNLPTPTGAETTVLNAISCPSRDACTAVGYYTGGDRHTHALAERWNGSSWNIMRGSAKPSGANGSALWGVSCTSVTSCTAVGLYSCGVFCNLGSEQPAAGSRPLVERSSASDWTVQPTPRLPFSTTASAFTAVSCSASGLCTAVGSFVYRGDIYPLAERYS